MKNQFEINKLGIDSILDKELGELGGVLEKISIEILSDLFIDLQQQNSNEIYNTIKITQKATRILNSKITTSKEKDAFQLGGLTIGISIYNQLLNLIMKNNEFDMKIDTLTRSEKVVKLLINLYEEGELQNKVIVNQIGGNYANQLLNELMECKMISKNKISKYSFYRLTPLGKKYIENNFAIAKENKKKYLLEYIDEKLTDFDEKEYKSKIDSMHYLKY